MMTLAQLAQSQQLSFQGDGTTSLKSVGTLEHAKADQISFLANSNYTQYLVNCQAGAVILSKEMAENYAGNALISKNPYLTFARIAQLFQAANAKANDDEISQHPSAVIDPTVKPDSSVSIAPLAVIHRDVQVGEHSVIGSHAVIHEGVKIGQNCVIKSGVIIEAGCVIGDRVIIHPGAVIGADGFGLAKSQEGWVKIPQTGVVIIGDDCEIGANTTIDCGAIENTVLGNDVRLDNQIQIGHNVVIGDHTVIAGCTAVAGSTEIGRNCFIAGGVGIVGHIKICDDVTVQAMALVTHSITQPGSYSSVPPLQPTNQWRRNAVRTKQLDKIARKVNKLEKKLK